MNSYAHSSYPYNLRFVGDRPHPAPNRQEILWMANKPTLALLISTKDSVKAAAALDIELTLSQLQKHY
ncbi:hypothetical protein D3C86_2174750 [compost metagenome]